jgi:peptidoglycan-N-acetylglucosamine deacetylase
MFHRTPFFLPWLYPDLVWRVPTTQKELFLTFDDGPVPGPTEFALDTLKEFNCRATFFCIGHNIQKHPEILNRIVTEGHAVGNHTYNHLKGWSTSVNQYVENVKLFDQQLLAVNDQLPVKLFRPPYGRITRNQIKALKNYKIVMWDVLTADYKKTLSPQACLKNSIAATRSGSIIVFHDSLKAERNMTYVLPRYLKHFLDLGYSFKTLPA